MAEAGLPEHWSWLSLKTPTLPPATHTNTALIHGQQRFIVVDPGTPDANEQARLLEAMEALLGRGLAFEGIFLTHQHVDHIGAVGAIQGWWADRGEGAAGLFGHEETFVALSADAASGPRTEIEDGQELDLGGVRLRAVHTPGHTRGHLSLVERAHKVAYGGDLVASQGTIIVNPPDGDMAAYLDSLRRVKAMGLSALLPSHGGLIEDVEGHLGHYIEHRLRREALVLGALTDAPLRPDELLPAAYPEVPVSLYPLAQRSLLAHLLKLVDEGRAMRHGGRWSAPVGKNDAG